MSDFGDFSSTPPAATSTPGFDTFGDASDPTADFIAREQAILGADAALFGNDGSVNLPSSDTTFGTSNTALGLDAPSFAPVPTADFGIPAQPIDFSNTGVSSAGSFTSAIPNLPPVPEPEQEPEAIKEWRENFQNTIAERDAKSNEKHEAVLRKAKEDLERFYAEYNDKKEKSIKKNKDHEKSTIAARDDTTSGTVWERVAKQIEPSTPLTAGGGSTKGKVDLKGAKLEDKSKDGKGAAAKPATKTRDTARMKQLIFNLRKDPNAPNGEHKTQPVAA
ncbi:hypothetical protein HDV00_003827 [Rhizophlyctis rosea]|nr:hypothetical protein HDV00_003827 [Rhizophlyctis rosea]